MPVDATDIEGAISRETFVKVLQACGVTVKPQEDATTDGMMCFEKDDYFESKRIPEVVRRKLLRYFERKFGVPIELFYNPHLIIKTPIQ